MPIFFGDSFEHENPNFSIVDIENIRGGAKKINEFNNTSLQLAFGGIPDKMKVGNTLLIDLSTDSLYYLSGSVNPNSPGVVTDDWTLVSDGGTSSGTIAELTDVDLMSPLADGDILVYNELTGTWINMPNTGGVGAQGDQGAQGAQGAQGDQGQTGAQGAQGDAGLSDLDVTQTTGTAISFDERRIYNTSASPGMTDITASATSARLGLIQKIYHQNSSTPTFTGTGITWVLIGQGVYINDTLNIIYAEWCDNNRIEYWITQPQ